MEREGDAVELETVKQAWTLIFSFFYLYFFVNKNTFSHFHMLHMLHMICIKVHFRQRKKSMKSHRTMSSRNQVCP